MYGARNTVSLLFLLPLGVLSLAAAFPAEAQSARAASASTVENVRVTDPSSGFAFQAAPSLVIDGQGRIFASWAEMNDIWGFNRVAFGRSLDGGCTWERSLVEVAAPGRLQDGPRLALDESDRVYYARLHLPGGLFVSRSDDGGRVWSPAVNIHDQPDDAIAPSTQADGNGTIYASYVTGGPSAPRDMKIIATRSVDGGVTWGPSRILVNGVNPFAPAIATRPNGTAHIVWWSPVSRGGNIVVSTTTDRGATWGSPVRVNPVSGSALYDGNIQPVRIPFPSASTSSGGSLFVAWADKAKGEYNIVVARSDDGGATWSVPVQVNDTDAGDQWNATLTMDAKDVLHAAWFDDRTGGINLYYATSTDGGRTWSPNLRVTTQETPSDTTPGGGISLAADRNGAAHLMWADRRDGGSAIYFARIGGCSAPSAPNVANNGPIRVGETLQLTASAVAGATYAWSGPNEFHSNLQNPSIANITTAAAGTYSVTVTVGGCTSDRATTTATILPAPCMPGPNALCLNSSRFALQVDWRVPSQGTSGRGMATPLTSDTGYFWFFSSNNVELVIKVVDGRAFNGFFWVFYGALSDVEYTITVTDTLTGAVKTYTNPQGQLASVADTAAFPGSGAATTGTEGTSPTSANLRRSDAAELVRSQTREVAGLLSLATPLVCVPDATTLCLNESRFSVRVDWGVPSQGMSGAGTSVSLTSDTGYFWFFSSNNVELVIKVLDGRTFNGRFWVFYGALSDVEYTITVTDTATGAAKTYTNPQGRLASVADTSAF